MTDLLLNDFFDSRTWSLTRAGLVAAGIVFWLAIGFWTFKDARRRIKSPWLVGLATLLGLVPPYLGALVYMLFRPPEYLAEVRGRELEMQAIEEGLAAGRSDCPVCRSHVEPSFLVCPVCTTRLKEACPSCKAPLDPLWQICPFCEARITRRPTIDLVEAFESTTVIEPTEQPPRPRRRASRKRPTSK
jgi:Double zinc ribbon